MYQGRFKSFPVETNEYLLTVCRYVERNPVRAGLVAQADGWRWGSAWQRTSAAGGVPLSEWPVERPANWRQWISEGETQEEIKAVRRSVMKGQPYGSERWVDQMVRQWNLRATLRGPGRPKKDVTDKNGS